jgi:hypothetical protein
MAERTPSNDQAAFGVFPQLKRNRSKQDREAAKNVPVDLARGAVAGVLGAPGDIESLVRMLPYIDEKTILPTSEDIEKRLPFKSDTPVSKAATGLGILGGGFYTGPGSPLRVVGALPKAIKRGAQDFALASAAGAPHVVKPKGGNWLSGGERDQIRTPEGDLRRLKLDTMMGAQGDTVEDVLGKKNAINNWIDSNLKNYVKKEMGTPEDPIRRLAEQGIIHTPLRDTEAAGDFLRAQRVAEGFPAEGMGRSNLARRWEDTADDSIRVTKAGAIQDQENTGAKLEKARAELEAHKEKINEDFIKLLKDKGGLSDKDRATFDKFPFFQKAEILGDDKYKELQGNINELLARESGFEKRAGELNPFVAKLDPETKLYSGSTYDLGFDHIVDVLKEDIATGRIRPEQLNKVSMEQAVRRTYEYDQELAKKMNEARLTSRAELPVHKEYPEGYKWVQLNRPGDFAAESNAMGHSSRGYEPPKGHPDWVEGSGDEGHLDYGHGGWEGIKSGRAKVYSLLDAKGEPHVTIETKAPSLRSNYDELQPLQRQADLEADAQNFQTFAERDKFADKRYQELKAQLMAEKKPEGDYTITQIKGKGNAKPKEDYLPFVQDFVKGGNWADVRDFHHTGLVREGDQIMTPAEHADWLLKQLDVPPAEGMKRGGVAISKNPDAMMLELNDRKMAKGGITKILKGAASEAERALPLRLTRAMPKPLSEINAHAERVARQMMGEHVTSGKAGDTKNLAGRSMKESQRVKALEYEFVPTKDVPESQVVESKLGDINVALPGDFTVSDVELKSLMGEPIGSRQEGGSRYGLGHLEDELPLFYASNEGPAQQVQNKVTELADLYGPERIMGHHMAMGPIATNFAQHFADANLRRIDYSKLRPADMYQFDKILSEGFVLPKKDKKTGQTTYKVVDFPDWPGIVDPQAAYFAMKQNPEMRKWFNKLMQTPKITEPLGLPNAQDVRYAITSPDLRDMEVNLTGHGVGELVPNAELTDTADHNTYLKGIRGIYKGHQDVLSPFPISFADAAQHIISTQRPQDFTGTIQKVFPHQIVDQQYLDEMGAYRKRLKELTGKKEGGAIKKPAAYIDGNEFVLAAQKYGIKDSMNNLNKIVDLVNKGLSVDDAARQVADTGMHKAAGGAITGDDLIIEERPL